MQANELISEFAHNQVVSKTIHMPPHHAEDWHSHSWHLVIFPVSGLLQSNIDNKSVIVPHNGMLYVPANTRHKSVSITKTRFLAIYLNPNSHISYEDKSKLCLVTPFLKELILLLIKQGQENHSGKIITNLLRVLRDQISIANSYEIPLLIPRDRRLMSIFTKIQEQPNLSLTLSEWAQEVRASSRTLSRLCAKEFDQSFLLWRKHIRLVLSLQSLDQNLPIHEIAMNLGYKSDSAYIYAFKGFFNQTPSKYRQHHLL